MQITVVDPAPTDSQHEMTLDEVEAGDGSREVHIRWGFSREAIAYSEPIRGSRSKCNQ